MFLTGNWINGDLPIVACVLFTLSCCVEFCGSNGILIFSDIWLMSI